MHYPASPPDHAKANKIDRPADKFIANLQNLPMMILRESDRFTIALGRDLPHQFTIIKTKLKKMAN